MLNKVILSIIISFIINIIGLLLIFSPKKTFTIKPQAKFKKANTIDYVSPLKKQFSKTVNLKINKMKVKEIFLVPELSSVNYEINIKKTDFDASNLIPFFGDNEIKGNFDVLMNEYTVDEPPTVILKTDPYYPSLAEDDKIEGFVDLKILVDKRGYVKKIIVLNSKPEGFFENSAKRAVKSWKFSPAVYNGNTVEVWCRQKIQYYLN